MKIFDEIEADEKALEDKKELARSIFGKKVRADIEADKTAPLMLKEMMKHSYTDEIRFEKFVVGEDYMPDHAIYIIFSPLTPEGQEVAIMTDARSEMWDEIGEISSESIEIKHSNDDIEYLEDILPADHSYGEDDLGKVIMYMNTLLDKTIEEEGNKIFYTFILQ